MLGDPLPDEVEILPAPERLEERSRKWLARDGVWRSFSADPPALPSEIVEPWGREAAERGKYDTGRTRGRVDRRAIYGGRRDPRSVTRPGRRPPMKISCAASPALLDATI